MCKTILLLSGAPGIGKSTLAKSLAARWGNATASKVNGVPVLEYDAKNVLQIGGIKDGFPGSDVLSIRQIKPAYEVPLWTPRNVFVEGLKLCNANFVNFVLSAGFELIVIHLEAPQEVLDARRVGRTQDKRWLDAMTNRYNQFAYAVNDLCIRVDASKSTDAVFDTVVNMTRYQRWEDGY